MFNLSLNSNLIQSLIYEIFYKGGKILFILILLIVLKKIGNVFVSKILNARLKSTKRSKEKIEKRKKTLKGVLSSILNVALVIIGTLTILTEVGVNILPLLAGAGIVGLAISMGASNLVKDYVSGLFILIEDQYRVGEIIEIAGVKGEVKDFDLRRTLIKDQEEVLHFIPNGQVTKSSNISREK